MVRGVMFLTLTRVETTRTLENFHSRPAASNAEERSHFLLILFKKRGNEFLWRHVLFRYICLF